MKGRFEFDADALFALLDECGLRSFYESALALCDVWFFGAEPTGLTESMQEFVLRGGVYGTLENQVSVGQSKRGGRARYVWGRIFVSTEHLTLSYPSLKGRKWLSPAYQVRRWFDIVFGGRLGRSVQEIKTSGGVSKDKERSTGELLDEIGLK